jgi:hypothetical protein
MAAEWEAQMACIPRTPLLILATLVMLIALPGCTGDVSPSDASLGPGTPGVGQASPSGEPLQGSPDTTPTESPPDWGNAVTWSASDPDAESGLLLSHGGDFDVEAVHVGQQQLAAYRTGNRIVLPSDDGNFIQDSYMQFNVDDAFLYGGTPTPRIRLEIDYLDAGNDTFFIEYDGSVGGPFNDGRFAETSYQIKTNSGEVRTAIFWMHDANFSNRDNGGDFRINDTSDGAETILRVTITRFMPDTDPATQIAMDFYHDGDQLVVGQCTTLHWVVQNATEVTLDGNPVDSRGSEFTCPLSTTTYSLSASNTIGQVEKELTISVSQPTAANRPAYDLAATCMNSYSCWTEAECHFFRVLSPHDSSGTSAPIVVNLYVGVRGYLSVVQSATVNPLEPGQAVILYYGGPVQCCQIVLRNNYDLDPDNDIFLSCK